MSNAKPAAIIDYGLGNVFSVLQACEKVGLKAHLTSARDDIIAAPAVILPGVGAFGDAMGNLRKLDLIGVLTDMAAEGKPIMGICLGLQLLMSESQEFGRHKGLGLIEGEVVRLPAERDDGRALKVPVVCWNQIFPPSSAPAGFWNGTLLDGAAPGSYYYFVHSYVVRPERNDVVLSTTSHGSSRFCSSLRSGNIWAFQFHPERSGLLGLKIYQNFKSLFLKEETHAARSH